MDENELAQIISAAIGDECDLAASRDIQDGNRVVIGWESGATTVIEVTNL